MNEDKKREKHVTVDKLGSQSCMLYNRLRKS